MAKDRVTSSRTRAGTWAIIHCVDTDKFLLGKRSSSANNGGVWNFFGGRIDRGEAPCRALVRELAEEAGLRVKPRQLTKISQVSGSAGARDLHYYLLTLDREIKPRLNGEHSDYRWFSRRSLPARFNRPTTVAIKQGLLKKVRA